MKKDQDPLMTRILEYLTIEDIGKTISMSCDIPLRLRLACTDYKKKYTSNLDEKGVSFQEKIAINNLEALNIDKEFVDTNEPLYKAIELGELLHCLQLWGSCEYAKDCWVTRRGFCQKAKETIDNGQGKKTKKNTRKNKDKEQVKEF
jgi:hypothetical protein